MKAKPGQKPVHTNTTQLAAAGDERVTQISLADFQRCCLFFFTNPHTHGSDSSLTDPPPGSLFGNEWSLKAEYKRGGNRQELADRLASRILWIGIANLLLCPVILVWQILYAFFSYTEVLTHARARAHTQTHTHTHTLPSCLSDHQSAFLSVI